MKLFRIFCDAILVFSVLILLSIQASFTVTGIRYETAEMIFLQIVHFSLLIVVVCNAKCQFKRRDIVYLMLTLFPLVGLCIAICLSFCNISFPIWTFYVFDSYCLVWFLYLLIVDCTTNDIWESVAPTVILTTERLILRPITIHDEADIFEYSSNPDVGLNAGWKPHENRNDTRKTMNLLFLNKRNIWGIQDTATGKVIGSIGLIADPLRENPNSVMIGYALSKDFWGKGIMTEACREVLRYAFEVLHVSIVSAAHYLLNDRSARVIEKCGFSKEGINRRAEVRYDGAILDKVVYSLTAEEWADRT